MNKRHNKLNTTTESGSWLAGQGGGVNDLFRKRMES